MSSLSGARPRGGGTPNDVGNRLGHRRRIIGFDEQPVNVVVHRFRNAAHARSNDRPLSGHGLEQHDRKGVGTGRNDDDVDVIEKRIDVDVTHEVDSRGETETRGLSS